MAVEKPKLTPVVENADQQAQEQTDPTSIFEDLDKLRSEATLTVRKREVLTVVEVGKPDPDSYFRVHPDPAMQLQCAIYKPKDRDTGTFFITKQMREHPLLIDKARVVLLVVTYSWPKRIVGLWPVPIDITGRGNSWWMSAWAAHEMAKTLWTQMQAGTDHYNVFQAEGELPEPQWPDATLTELLKKGFADKIIDSDDVAIMRRLRGLE
jgi:hypothetical protein